MNDQNTVTIYALADPENPKVPRYVGRTSRALAERYREHLSDASCRPEKQIVFTWVKSLLDNGKKPLIFSLETCTEADGDAREAAWILFFKPLGLLTNVATGPGATGVPRTREHREAVAARNRLGWSEETRAKQIAVKTGRRLSEDTKQERRTTSGFLSAQTKLIARNRQGGFKVRREDTGEIYDSYGQAASALGCSSANVYRALRCNGTCKGVRLISIL